MSLSPYDYSLELYDIDRLRSARSVVIRQHRGVATITCRGSLSGGANRVSGLVSTLRSREHAIPVHPATEPFSAKRRWSRDRALELTIDATRLDPAWIDAVRTLAPGSRVALAWNRDRDTGRYNADAVQMTVTTPFGGRSSHTLTGAPRWEQQRGRRQQSRRIHPLRAGVTLLGLWLLASNSVMLAAVTASALFAVVSVSRWARGGAHGRIGPRLWKLSVFGVVFSVVPVVAGVALLGYLGWRFRRGVRRLVGWAFGKSRPRGGIAQAGSGWPADSPFATHPSPSSLGGGNRARVDFENGNRAEAERVTLEHFVQHVDRVADMFDALVPGWAHRVNPELLNPADPADHLVTAAFHGDFDGGLAALLELCDNEGRPDRKQCVRASLDNEPCDELPQTVDGTHNEALTRLWTHAILQRRGIRQPA